jgi:hypothetical protein
MKKLLNNLPQFLKSLRARTLVIFLAISILIVIIIIGKPTRRKFLQFQTQNTETVQYKDSQSFNAQETSQWLTYQNNTYNLQIQYPADWHVFIDEAEADFADLELDDSQAVKQGGAVFWSNKDNIDYTEETKSDDFHLLGLVLYEKPDTGLDDFAQFLGFTNEVETQQIVFKADNVIGKEYISVGATEAEPRAAIIFKDNDRFYAFHLGFIGNDPETLKTMENIVGSFHLGDLEHT